MFERVKGIEPSSSAWKADALAVVLYSQKFNIKLFYLNYWFLLQVKIEPPSSSFPTILTEQKIFPLKEPKRRRLPVTKIVHHSESQSF